MNFTMHSIILMLFTTKSSCGKLDLVEKLKKLLNQFNIPHEMTGEESGGNCLKVSINRYITMQENMEYCACQRNMQSTDMLELLFLIGSNFLIYLENYFQPQQQTVKGSIVRPLCLSILAMAAQNVPTFI